VKSLQEWAVDARRGGGASRTVVCTRERHFRCRRLHHESAYVDDGAQVGAGTKIWHFCHVMPGAVIGEQCSLGQNVVVMNGTRMGANCKIQNNVSIYEGVELEDDVFCGRRWCSRT
jgi:UDP-3-O-[3-hydroxymyristoyl] glucosamine N-acyltransferase